MESVVIGVDHGFSAMKTAHCVFPTGLTAYDFQPYTQKGILEYGGRFYVIGTGRQPIQKDKTRTENYYLLTLAAIAQEITIRNADPALMVHLAAGLPLTSFGREAEKFRKYLLRDRKPVSFRYEGRDFLVTINKVSMYPQGYAAALTRSELSAFSSLIIVDIGGWTMDLMRLNGRTPEEETRKSLETGVICCIDSAMEKIRGNLGLSVNSEQVESVLRGETESVPEQAVLLVQQEAEAYVQTLFNLIDQSGMDIHATPTMFVGGGAALIKSFCPASENLFKPIILDDVTLNAKAYEQLAVRRSRQGANE